MAGSLKYFRYQLDNGDIFAIYADESNMESIHVDPPAFEYDVTTANLPTVTYKLPANVDPRKARYKSLTSPRVREIIVPTQAMYNDLVSATGAQGLRSFVDPDTAETFTFRGVTPELVKPIVISEDTGLIDGDDT